MMGGSSSKSVSQPGRAAQNGVKDVVSPTAGAAFVTRTQAGMGDDGLHRPIFDLPLHRVGRVVEEDVGITEVLVRGRSPLSGCALKTLWEDFKVNEISEAGVVVRVTDSTSLPGLSAEELAREAELAALRGEQPLAGHLVELVRSLVAEIGVVAHEQG